MNNTGNNKNKEIDINLVPIFFALLKKVWLIVLVALVFAAGSYTMTKIFIHPTYRSGFTAYVNNQTQVVRDSVSSSDIFASQQLVLTYSKILKSDTVLMPAAKAIDLDYSYEKLVNMVSTQVEDETEIINVYVVSGDPQTAYDLASSIAKVSPRYMADIVEGSSMKIIDNPKMPKEKFAPSYFRMGLIGALIGALLAIVFIIINYFRDDTIKDEKDLEERFGLPVVGIIPDMNPDEASSDSYYNNYYYHKSNANKGGVKKDGEGE